MMNDGQICGEWWRYNGGDSQEISKTTSEDSLGMTNCWKKDTGEYSKYVLSIGSDMTWHFRIYLTVLEISHKKFIQSEILEIPNREIIQDKNKLESSH